MIGVSRSMASTEPQSSPTHALSPLPTSGHASLGWPRNMLSSLQGNDYSAAQALKFFTVSGVMISMKMLPSRTCHTDRDQILGQPRRRACYLTRYQQVMRVRRSFRGVRYRPGIVQKYERARCNNIGVFIRECA